jgi:HAD superfamily hydrolase (TIGR01549 family)
VARITALLFDFGGTLDGTTHWLDRFLAGYRAAGVEITRDELDAAFQHATQVGYGATRVVARFGIRDTVRFLVGHQFEHLYKNGPQPLRERLSATGASGRHRLVESVTNHFVQETNAGLAHSREVIAPLRSRFKLGIVSNFYGNLDRILEEAKLARYFSAVADSSRVQSFKPEVGIFEAALKKLQCAHESAAMIGDSLGKDCAPARKLGMRTVWLCADGRRDEDSGAADVTIRDLDEVARIQW